MSKTDKAAMAEKLINIAERLQELSSDIGLLGWVGHQKQLLSMSSLAGIYAHHIKSSILMSDDK